MDRISMKTMLSQNGITIVGLAARAGVSTVTIYDVLAGKRSSREKVEPMLEAVFGIPIADIRKAWNTVPSAEEFAARKMAFMHKLGIA